VIVKMSTIFVENHWYISIRFITYYY
jgi:hypothetical protein